MEFLSFSFAGFGALVFAGWWILPAKARPWLLAAANLLFAGMFGSRTLVCLLLLCLAGYLCGRLLEKRPSRFVLWVGVLLCLAPLAACKYLPLAVPSLFAAVFFVIIERMKLNKVGHSGCLLYSETMSSTVYSAFVVSFSSIIFENRSMLHFNFEATISRYVFLSSVPTVITDEETLSHSDVNTWQAVKTVLATLLCII